MCVYDLIIEVKWVYDVYQYIFSHRESMCRVSSIYPLSKKLFSLQEDQKSRKESHKKELMVEVDADRISLHYLTTEVDADRISVRQHMDKEGDKN